MAFDEAIERFDIKRSKSFLKFAEMVIKKRMKIITGKYRLLIERNSFFVFLQQSGEGTREKIKYV